MIAGLPVGVELGESVAQLEYLRDTGQFYRESHHGNRVEVTVTDRARNRLQPVLKILMIWPIRQLGPLGPMIFLLFLASLVTLEVILRHDKTRERKSSPQAPDTRESILALMNGVEQHGRGPTPAVHTEAAVSERPINREPSIIGKDV